MRAYPYTTKAAAGRGIATFFRMFFYKLASFTKGLVGFGMICGKLFCPENNLLQKGVLSFFSHFHIFSLFRFRSDADLTCPRQFPCRKKERYRTFIIHSSIMGNQIIFVAYGTSFMFLSHAICQTHLCA